MTQDPFESHDIIVFYVITLGFLLMSALHTILISQKCTNIGAVFRATIKPINQIKLTVIAMGSKAGLK
jgi:hypothetical protein